MYFNIRFKASQLRAAEINLALSKTVNTTEQRECFKKLDSERAFQRKLKKYSDDKTGI